MLLDVIDGVLNGANVLRLFVWDFDIKLFFHVHHEFNQVQRISAQVIDKRCLGNDLRSFLVELLSDDIANSVLYVAMGHLAF